jgi:Tfp pilus assembly protein PilF
MLGVGIVAALVMLVGYGVFSKKIPQYIGKMATGNSSTNPVSTMPPAAQSAAPSSAAVQQQLSSPRNVIVSTQGEQARQHLNQGKEFMKQDNFPEALKSFAQAITYKPDYPDAFYYRGLAHHKQKSHELAMQDYTRAIELKPDYASAYNNRGNVYLDLKQYDNAMQDYTRAIALKADFALPYNNRGLARQRKGDYKGALQDFEHALVIDPHYVHAQQNLAKVNKQLGIKSVPPGQGVTSYSNAPETFLLKLETLAAVYNNPSKRTLFTLRSRTHITKVMTYHWNGGAGDRPGTIGIRNVRTGQMMGTWNVVATKGSFDFAAGATWPRRGDGPPYRYWTIQPKVDLPAGAYEVVDSNPSTWSHNPETGNRGVAFVYGGATGN